jgi:hypothetical protein
MTCDHCPCVPELEARIEALLAKIDRLSTSRRELRQALAGANQFDLISDVIEPRSIDEARLQMVHDLHRAVLGATWARPEPPADVWRMLLDRVERVRKAMS